jgi:hypothetical protein
VYSNLLVSRWRNACFTSSKVVLFGFVVAGVRPASVQPRSLLKYWESTRVCVSAWSAHLVEEVSSKEKVNASWFIELFISQLDVLGNLPVISNFAGGVVSVMLVKTAQSSVVCQSVCLELKCSETLMCGSVYITDSPT